MSDRPYMVKHFYLVPISTATESCRIPAAAAAAAPTPRGEAEINVSVSSRNHCTYDRGLELQTPSLKGVRKRREIGYHQVSEKEKKKKSF